MKKILFDNVYKSYNNNQILKNINFSIEDNECFVIVGPSGSGKSTILNLIAGLITPETGIIKMEEKDVSKEKPKDRNVSMVFQNFALYPHMTVRGNISFALKSKGMNKKVIEEKTKNIAEKLHIEKLMNRKPQELSGGQKQRVALARALVTEAEVILMDEPLSSLDSDLRIKLQGELKKFHKENNTTLVFVTHDQREAMTLADRILVLNDGQIEQIDTPKEIYERPKTPFVGKFIGTPKINFFRDEKNNLFGIRPENIRINDKNIGEKVVIESIDYLGSENWVRFIYQDSSFILTTQNKDLIRRQEIYITFDKTKIIRF